MWDVPEPDEFGALLRHYRLDARLTQEALAERAGLAVRSIPGLEAGEHQPQSETLRRLVEALGLTQEQRVHLTALAGRGADSRASLRRANRWRHRNDRRAVGAERGDGRAPEEARHPPHNLPLQLTSFVGQERELASIALLFNPPDQSVAVPSRLVTLTGSGGCGKTRLALRVAERELHVHPDGVWFIDLSPLADPALVPQTVLATLDPSAPSDRTPLEALLHHLRARHALVILDNCEHMLDACSRLAEALLLGCPRLRILATSREALGVAGELSRVVPSLAVPDPDHVPRVASLMDYEAVHLFAERAAAVKSDFVLTDRNATAVVQVCHRLEGIPLAIELAAARIRGLAPEEIAARVDSRLQLLTVGSRTAPPRHQTLRAAVAWSYDLLTDREQCLFDRLSVFARGLDNRSRRSRLRGGWCRDCRGPRHTHATRGQIARGGGRY